MGRGAAGERPAWREQEAPVIPRPAGHFQLAVPELPLFITDPQTSK